MITLQELRIGNIIESGIVDGIHPNGVIEVINKNGAREFLHHLSLEKPIPLTEEWLLRFGFEKQEADTDFKYIYRNAQCRVSENNDGFLSYWPEEMWGFSVDIQYVHQLQNLNFALTGEELKVKELA